MTWICYRGIELSARRSSSCSRAEIDHARDLRRRRAGQGLREQPGRARSIRLSWFNPFAIGSCSALVDGVLLGVFIYWGWDSGVAVNEESEAKEDGPGRAAVVGTLVLLLIYVIVSAAAQAYGGTKLLGDNPDDVLSVLGNKVFGAPLDKLLIIAVLTSAVGVDADDDPAHRANDAVDGAQQGDTRGLRARPPALPDAERARRR